VSGACRELLTFRSAQAEKKLTGWKEPCRVGRGQNPPAKRSNLFEISLCSDGPLWELPFQIFLTAKRDVGASATVKG